MSLFVKSTRNNGNTKPNRGAEEHKSTAAVSPGTSPEVSQIDTFDSSLTSPETERFIKALKDLKDEDGRVRCRAAEALGYVGDAEAVPELVEALRDESGFVRMDAAEALGRVGDAKAVPGVIEALKDEGNHIRREAAGALGSISDAKAVPALIEALKDKYEGVRWSAAEALGSIGDAKAVPALIEALKDESGYLRENAAFALGTPTLFEALRNLKDGHSHIKAALDLIRVALKSSDRLTNEQKRTAASALGQFGDAAAARQLIGMLADEDALVRAAAADALVLLGELAAPALQDAMKRGNTPARECIKAILDRLKNQTGEA